MRTTLLTGYRKNAAAFWGLAYLWSIFAFALVYMYSDVPFVQSTAIQDQNIKQLERDLALISEIAINQSLAEWEIESDEIRIYSNDPSNIVVTFFLEKRSIGSERVHYSGILVPVDYEGFVDAHGVYRGNSEIRVPMNGNYIRVYIDKITLLEVDLNQGQEITHDAFSDYLTYWQSKVSATDHLGNDIIGLERMPFGSLHKLWLDMMDGVDFSQVGDELLFATITLKRELSGTIDPATSFTRMLYFSTATATTLGYGDIVPVNDRGRIFVIFQSISSVVMIGLFLNSVSSRGPRLSDNRQALPTDE